MSALRYSGAVRVRLTYLDSLRDDTYADGTPRHPNGSYRCTLTLPSGARKVATVGAPYLAGVSTCHSVIVGAPRSLSHAVDSSEAFDDTARAALAFASHDDTTWGDAAAYAADGSGYHVGRSPATAHAPKVHTWADGSGRWYARVSRAAASPLLAARQAIRAELEARDPKVAPHAWRDLDRAGSRHDTPDTIVFCERSDTSTPEVHS